MTRRKELYCLFLISFFMHASIYSVHNFISEILKQSEIMDVKKTMATSFFDIFKFITSLIACSISDRKGIHKYVFGIAIFAHSIIVLVIYNVDFIKDLNMRFYALYILIPIMYCFNGATFPILDSMMINYLKNNSSHVVFIGRMRSGGALGHLFINILLSCLHKLKEKNILRKNMFGAEYTINIVTSLLFSLIAMLFSFFYAPDYVLSEDLKSKSGKKWNFRKFWKDICALFSIFFAFYCLAVLCQGIDRIAISMFLTKYFKAIGLENSDIHLIYFFRCLPEILIYGISEWISRFLSIEFMFCIAICISSMRSFFYATFNFTGKPQLVVYSVLYMTEFMKGLFSSFYQYSTIRIFSSFSSPETISTSQGILYNLYNSLPNVFFSLMKFATIKEEENGKGDKIEYELRQLFLLAAFISIFSLIVPMASIISKRIRRKKMINEIFKYFHFSILSIIFILSTFSSYFYSFHLFLLFPFFFFFQFFTVFNHK